MIRVLKRVVLASILAIGLLSLGAGQSQAFGQSRGGHGGGYGGYRGGFGYGGYRGGFGWYPGGYGGWGGWYFPYSWGY